MILIWIYSNLFKNWNKMQWKIKHTELVQIWYNFIYIYICIMHIYLIYVYIVSECFTINIGMSCTYRHLNILPFGAWPIFLLRIMWVCLYTTHTLFKNAHLPFTNMCMISIYICIYHIKIYMHIDMCVSMWVLKIFFSFPLY